METRSYIINMQIVLFFPSYDCVTCFFTPSVNLQTAQCMSRFGHHLSFQDWSYHLYKDGRTSWNFQSLGGSVKCLWDIFVPWNKWFNRRCRSQEKGDGENDIIHPRFRYCTVGHTRVICKYGFVAVYLCVDETWLTFVWCLITIIVNQPLRIVTVAKSPMSRTPPVGFTCKTKIKTF